MNRHLIIFLGLLLLSSLSVHAVIIPPSATGADSKTYLQNYENIINGSLQSKFNTTVQYTVSGVTYLTVPEFQSSTACLMNGSGLVTTYLGNAVNGSIYEVRSDAYSEAGIGLSMSNRSNEFHRWVNFLEIMDICGYGQLPCWVVARNSSLGGNQIGLAGGQNDTAIDGSVRAAIALYLAVNNTNFTAANRTHYLNLANNLTRDIYLYETISITTKLTRAGTNVTRLPMGGGDCASAGLGCSTDMWVGYLGDIIKLFQYGCFFTGNSTYCAAASNFTAATISVSLDRDTDGDGFGVAPFNFNWNTTGTYLGIGGGGGVNSYHYSSANEQWDDSDAPRFMNFCDILRVQNLSQGSINGVYNYAAAYCGNWSRSSTYNAGVTSLQYYYNGTCATNCNATGYYPNGLGVYESTYYNTSYVSTKVNETLTHYSWSGNTFDSSSCGTGLMFRGVKATKALGSAIGLDERWYSAPAAAPSSTYLITINVTDLVNGSTIPGLCAIAYGNTTNYTGCNATGTTVTLNVTAGTYNITAHTIGGISTNITVQNPTKDNGTSTPYLLYTNDGGITDTRDQYCIEQYGPNAYSSSATNTSATIGDPIAYYWIFNEPHRWLYSTVVGSTQIVTNITCAVAPYFNATRLNYNASATATVTLNSSQALLEMRATAIFINVSQSSVSFTNGIYVNNSGSTPRTIPANIGLNNIRADTPGFFTKNGTCQVTTPLQTVPCNVTDIYNDIYTINATDIYSDTPITSFSLILIATIIGHPTSLNIYQILNTTNGTITLPLLRTDGIYTFNPVYTYNFSSTGYEYQNATLSANASNQSYTFEVLPAPSVDITIRDTNGNLITQNITINIISNITGETFYTVSGGYFAVNLTSGSYTVKLSGANYSQSTYAITITTGNVYFLTAYLQATGTDDVVFQFVDNVATSVTLPNVQVSQLTLVNGSYVVISTKLTDITGRATFGYFPDTAYQFIAISTGYQTKSFTLDPIEYSSYTVQMQRTTSLDFDQDFQSVYVAYAPNIFYDGEQNQINITFNSPLGTFTTYSYTITYPGGTNTGSGTNINGEIFTIDFNITGATYLDKVNITLTYDTSVGPSRSFNYSNGIIINPGDQTFIANRDNTYGLGLLERIIIGTFIIIVVAGLITLGAGPLWGMAIALFIMGVWIKIGFWPWWAAGLSFLVGFALIAGRSD